MMKREVVLRLLLHIWSGCGGLLNRFPVADTKRCRRGDASYGAFSRWTCINDKAYCFKPCWRFVWVRPVLQCLPVPVCVLLCVIRTAFGRLVECSRVNCA